MNYAKLYAILCGAASDAVELMDAGNIAGARACLLAALEETEELYIRAIGRYYMEENERLQCDPDAAVPEEVTRRDLAFIADCFDREKTENE